MHALPAHSRQLVVVDRLLEEYADKLAAHKEICKSASAFAREIEKLAPAADRQDSPANAEYPWESGSDLLVPCKYSYPTLSLLNASGGRAFLKLIDRAFRDY